MPRLRRYRRGSTRHRNSRRTVAVADSTRRRDRRRCPPHTPANSSVTAPLSRSDASGRSRSMLADVPAGSTRSCPAATSGSAATCSGAASGWTTSPRTRSSGATADRRPSWSKPLTAAVAHSPTQPKRCRNRDSARSRRCWQDPGANSRLWYATRNRHRLTGLHCCDRRRRRGPLRCRWSARRAAAPRLPAGSSTKDRHGASPSMGVASLGSSGAMSWTAKAIC